VTAAPDATQGAPPPPKPRRRRLGNLRNVKAGLADVIHRLETEGLDVKRGNALVYAYSSLAGIIVKEIETEKLSAIEAQLATLTAEVKR
jgi:hypothetical protein